MPAMRYAIYSKDKMKYLDVNSTISQPCWTTLLDEAILFDDKNIALSWVGFIPNSEILVTDGENWHEMRL